MQIPGSLCSSWSCGGSSEGGPPNEQRFHPAIRNAHSKRVNPRCESIAPACRRSGSLLGAYTRQQRSSAHLPKLDVRSGPAKVRLPEAG